MLGMGAGRTGPCGTAGRRAGLAGVAVLSALLLASLSFSVGLAQQAGPGLGDLEKSIEQLDKKIDPPKSSSQGTSGSQTNSGGIGAQNSSQDSTGGSSGQTTSQGSNGGSGGVENAVSNTVEKQIAPQVESTGNQLDRSTENRVDRVWDFVDKTIQPTVERFMEKTPTPTLVPPTSTPPPPTETPFPPTATPTAPSGGPPSEGGEEEVGEAAQVQAVAAAAPQAVQAPGPQVAAVEPTPPPAPTAEAVEQPTPEVAGELPAAPPPVVTLPVTGEWDPASLAILLTLVAGSGLALRWLARARL